MKLKGVPLSPGIVWGRALLFETQEESLFRITLEEDQVMDEVRRLWQAIENAKHQIREIRDQAAEEMGEEYATIFDAHLLMLEDQSLTKRSEGLILKDRINAEWALKSVVDEILDVFARQDSQLIQERAADLEDVANRVQKNLAGTGTGQAVAAMQEEDVIIIAPGLSPSDAVLLDRTRVRGFATDKGGPTSHTAIIARSLEIPAVVGLKNITKKVRAGDVLLVDGTTGDVFIRPSEELLKEYKKRKKAYREREARLVELAEGPAYTQDGVRIDVHANIDLPSEVEMAEKFHATGIGLYRSEFLFLEHGASLPSEDDHFRAYDDMAKRMYPARVVIRTLDLGGEKFFHDVLDKGEQNPVLGLRAIRFCLRRPDLFKTQIKGILRASHRGNVDMMFPLISSVDELRKAKTIVEKAKKELTGEGVQFDEDIPVGIMIEVPSAAMISDILANEVDFFSIGTNDLIQYLLAIDRNNDSVNYVYEPLHPAILRTIQMVAANGGDHKIRIGICGEMASDPRLVPVLIGLGIRDLSMTPISIPLVKEAIRNTNAEAMTEAARRMMTMSRARDVESYLTRKLGQQDSTKESG